MTTKSILTLADSYKFSHSSQYPSNMVSMYDYFASRGGIYDSIVVAGLQYYIKEYLLTPITQSDIDRVSTMAHVHGVPFDYDGWMHILTHHDGYLPVRIMSIPEGTLIPVGIVQMTVESTDSKVPWIAGFIETLLMKTYYPTLCATKSYHIKQILHKYGSPEWAQFALHNFGDRACHSPESAALSGFGHATQFLGTDNFNSLFFMEDYYNQPVGTPACYSVYATEHSSTTSNCCGTTREHRLIEEEQFVYSQLVQHPDRAIMSFVADSTDVYAFTRFCTAPDSRIRSLIESRPHQKLVLRPDSGDPIEVIAGMLHIMVDADLRTLSDESKNEKHLFRDFGILCGDGITTAGVDEILQLFTTHTEASGGEGTPFAAENFVFGMGGGLATIDMHRDTSKYAIKCSSITINLGTIDVCGPYDIMQDIDVYKDPITDPGKASLRGKVTSYIRPDGSYFNGLVGQLLEDGVKPALILMYENGTLHNETSLADIRASF